MEAKLVTALPPGPGWQFEPKWDGFRCLAFKSGPDVDLRAKSGKPLARFFPEMLAALAQSPLPDIVLDGELIITPGGFSALQQRLHPAESRIRKLAATTPALLMAFDCLASPQSDLHTPLQSRRTTLERLLASIPPESRLRLSPSTTDPARAQAWLDEAPAALDGVIAKRRDAPYAPGRRDMFKVKRLRTADCVIGGYRTYKDTDQVGSLLLGLYDDTGRLDHVGFCSAITTADRPALTARLLPLHGGPGFSGIAPGGPSRWSTERSTQWQPLRPELVVEVTYDQVTDGRFRHGTALRRWRPDKSPRQCTREQLAPPADPATLLEILGTP